MVKITFDFDKEIVTKMDNFSEDKWNEFFETVVRIKLENVYVSDEELIHNLMAEEMKKEWSDKDDEIWEKYVQTG